MEKATAYGARVLTVPTLAELNDGTASVGQLRPVKIIDLARNMIRLAARTLRDKDHPTGEIEIQITGTRPGEKLYEELLISSDSTTTEHASIGLAREPFESWNLLEAKLDRLQTAVDQRDDGVVRKLLGELVGGYETSAVKSH